MIRWGIVAFALVLAAAADEPSSVVFDVQALRGDHGSRQWIATYSSGRKIARFRIDLGAPEAVPGKPGMKSGEGTLLPEPGSDSSVLLVDLQKALRAKTAPAAPQKKTSVPFTYVYSGDPNALRLTFGEGTRESEVLLNIDGAAKKAKFAMKDPRYGDLVLAELAKVL